MKKYSIIDDELKRAEAKHPNYPEDMFRQLAIMNEEAGEATKAVLHYHYENGSLEDVKVELVQTAAMCMRMIESIDNTIEFNKNINKCSAENSDRFGVGTQCSNLENKECKSTRHCNFKISASRGSSYFYGVFKNDHKSEEFIARVKDTSGKTWRIDDHDKSYFFALPETFIRHASVDEIELHKNRKNV